MNEILEQHILAVGKRRQYLNRGRLLNLTIKKVKDQKRCHTALASDISFDPHTLWEIDGNIIYKYHLFFQEVQIH